MENLSLVYDHTQGKTVPGYEVLTLGLLTPRNFWPVDFDFRFSRTAPEGAREARPRKDQGGDLARRLKAGRDLTKPELALKMLQGRPGSRDSGLSVCWWTPGLPLPNSVRP